MDWYSFLNQIGLWFSKPVSDLYYGIGEQTPLIGALLLGIIGAFAPCQMSGNVAAFTVFGKRVISDRTFGSSLFLFILGKVVVYSILGGIVFIFGEQLSTQAIPLFQWARKLLAPLFLVIGLFLIGWIRLPFIQTQSLIRKMEPFTNRFGGKTQSFLLGFTFSLGFCPTMFWLFFGLAMPLMLSSSAGPILPPIFAIGTAVPLAFVLVLLAVASDRPFVLKKARKLGSVVQKVAGGVFIILGISDFFTFW
ncbi:sulfite exporter TauE/SafE family protein [Brevibacillus choshinensis]|uniref:cytochrome c biogenesis CcdA family protein n=1 Tax=Brevibacillus choshinensis TaxID=54911 RepID=UPI002E23A52B|nr:sulfite exporter TauE/SafE family protein [Brevibacillus choshinensis]